MGVLFVTTQDGNNLRDFHLLGQALYCFRTQSPAKCILKMQRAWNLKLGWTIQRDCKANYLLDCHHGTEKGLLTDKGLKAGE
jgi:hypothetical protein